MLRGDIYYVDFGVPIGSEQGGHRPALIIQNDVGNKSAQTTIIAAITSKIYSAKYPFHVEISSRESGLPRDGTVKLEHLKTISKQRLLSLAGKLSEEKMREVDEALRYSLGIVSQDKLIEESDKENQKKQNIKKPENHKK